MKVTGSDPVIVDGQGSDETLYTKYNVKYKATVQDAYHSWDEFLSSGSSYWASGFGMTPSYIQIVQNSSYDKIVDYYNVYDGDKANAEFVTTIKNNVGVAPSTDVAGWDYQGSDSEVVENTYTVNHTRVNRYYTKLQDKTFSYKLKYKAVYSDGSPAEGISLKGEVTGADGFISGVDTYDITLKNLAKQADGSYSTASKATEYYTLNPNETDSVINFTGNNKNYSVKASWNVSDRTQTVTADGKPESVSHSFSTADRYADAKIDIEDDFTSVFVLNVGDKEDTDTVDIPIKVNYYYQKNGNESLVTSENTTISKKHVYIPQEAMQKIFERFPEGSSAYIPIMIGYHTGLRLGEIYGLVWEDIDFKNKTLSVNRQVQWEAGEARSEEEKKKTNGTSESNG